MEAINEFGVGERTDTLTLSTQGNSYIHICIDVVKLRSYSYKSIKFLFVIVWVPYDFDRRWRYRQVLVSYQLAFFALMQYVTIFMRQTVLWHFQTTSGIK